MQSVSHSAFVHLHAHSQYSLLTGAMRVHEMVARAAELGMPALALTDSNNLFGAIDFYFAAQKAGIKPIIGCQLYYAPEGKRKVRPQAFEPEYFFLNVLCKNHQGYKNLCQMITLAAQTSESVVTRDLLKRFGQDLIILSGGLKGEVAYQITQGETEEALATAQWMQKNFGENFYFELQDTLLPEQGTVNELLYDWSKKFGIGITASNPCYYLKREDHEAHEVLQCIPHGRNLDFDRPQSLVPAEYYLKSTEEMQERFSRFPEVFESVERIVQACNLEFVFKDAQGNPIYHLPNYRPEGVSKEETFDVQAHFREEAAKGLEQRFTETAFESRINQPTWEAEKKAYFDRLQMELDMIVRTGFAGYFLIVADFINWAKRHQIPVGPGRGSGAGSIVAWSLRITDLDPIEFNLLFERFINPERISMPDFDVDFCQDRRGEVIEYVGRKYGKDNVCQIITFGKLQARAVVKDVARVMGLSFAESDQITKLFPDELNISLSKALEKEPRLQELINSDSRLKKVMDYSLKLEGLYRNAGVHAAGVIITEDPVVSYCPLYVGTDGLAVTQFDKDFSEKIGLVKFDFLGLKTLTVIDYAVRLIREGAEEGSELKNFSIERIPYNDPKVYELIGSGDTDGVFQVESSGMKDLCSRLKPGNVEDLTAINALYRPGPLGSGMVDDFIDRKHGRKPIEYLLPQLEVILKDTYGVILYQEQVMQIARELAGYSLGQADMLRRAMGKKKADEMAKHREIFLKGASEKQLDIPKAEAIYDLMAKFAEYGFNKSHSAAYAVLTYQTAYLKTHHAAEFMAALMSTEVNNTDKITRYIGDARAHAIEILAPDVNHSQKSFSVEKGKDGRRAVRFGLSAIKGVGGIAVDTILAARESAAFVDLLDFFKRVSTRKVNKKVCESLTYAGAFDSIRGEVNRATLFNSIGGLLEHAAEEQEERALGQTSLFDSFSAEEIRMVTPTDSLIKRVEDWPQARRLAFEKSVVGFYVSGHPMDQWQAVVEDWLGWSIRRLIQYVEDKQARGESAPAQATVVNGRFQRPQRKEVKLAGLMGTLKEIVTKKGKRMAFGTLEDLEGKIDIVFFPDSFTQLEQKIRQAVAEVEVILITGELDMREGNPQILVNAIDWAKDAHKDRAQRVVLNLQPQGIQPEQMRELKNTLARFRGKCPVEIRFIGQSYKTRMELSPHFKVQGTPKLVAAINRLFGQSVVELR